MALGSTQPPVKMSTRNIPGGKGGQCVRLTTSPPSECHGNLEAQTSWIPLGYTGPVTGLHYLYLLWATPGLLRDSITFTFSGLHRACYGTPLPLPSLGYTGLVTGLHYLYLKLLYYFSACNYTYFTNAIILRIHCLINNRYIILVIVLIHDFSLHLDKFFSNNLLSPDANV